MEAHKGHSSSLLSRSFSFFCFTKLSYYYALHYFIDFFPHYLIDFGVYISNVLCCFPQCLLSLFLSRPCSASAQQLSPSQKNIMDPSELRTGRPSPRRELQGPRPTPLKVQKDSHKIKKPPVAPPPQHRPPVIIYTVSPKVIHTTPGDFMSLVQRLTGSSSSSSSAAAAAAAARSPSNVNTAGEALSPAARFATIEKGAHKLDGEMQRKKGEDILNQLGIDGGTTMIHRHGSFPGILSPVPASLPPVSPKFFSPSMETNSLSFFHELSPAFHGNKNFLENTFLVSPNNFLTTPVVPSPGAYWDLFNQYQDF